MICLFLHIYDTTTDRSAFADLSISYLLFSPGVESKNTPPGPSTVPSTIAHVIATVLQNLQSCAAAAAFSTSLVILFSHFSCVTSREKRESDSGQMRGHDYLELQ